jgi:hypothetical protein
MGIREQVKGWNSDAEGKRVICLIHACDDCGSVDLVFCEIRGRIFLAVVAEMVIRLASYVVRFRCRACGKRMTQWPPFALPYMRYVKVAILLLCETYVERLEATYQNTVDFIGYESEEPGKVDERKPSTWTLWNWLSRLGEMDGTLLRARDMIMAKCVSDDLHRQAEPISPLKYRSEARRGILTAARSLIRAERRYVELFQASCFPNFQTG